MAVLPIPDYLAELPALNADDSREAVHDLLRGGVTLPEDVIAKWLTKLGDAAITLSLAQLLHERRVRVINCDEHGELMFEAVPR